MDLELLGRAKQAPPRDSERSRCLCMVRRTSTRNAHAQQRLTTAHVGVNFQGHSAACEEKSRHLGYSVTANAASLVHYIRVHVISFMDHQKVVGQMPYLPHRLRRPYTRVTTIFLKQIC